MDIELCDDLLTQFTVTGLVGGTDYKFKVRARNVYDYGEFSDVYSVEASDMPGKPVVPKVSLTGTDVVIEWEAPWSHSALITEYEILFKKADNSFVEYELRCDGSDPVVIGALACSVPMLELEPLTGLMTNQQI